MEAAEAHAAEIRQTAEEDAERIRGEAGASTARLLERIDLLERHLAGIDSNIRRERDGLSSKLSSTGTAIPIRSVAVSEPDEPPVAPSPPEDAPSAEPGLGPESEPSAEQEAAPADTARGGDERKAAAGPPPASDDGLESESVEAETQPAGDTEPTPEPKAVAARDSEPTSEAKGDAGDAETQPAGDAETQPAGDAETQPAGEAESDAGEAEPTAGATRGTPAGLDWGSPVPEEVPGDDSGAVEEDASTAGKRRRFGLLRRGRQRPFIEVAGQCSVCERTLAAGSEEVLGASGWRLSGDRGLCPKCQSEGWTLAEGGDLPYRRGLF